MATCDKTFAMLSSDDVKALDCINQCLECMLNFGKSFVVEHSGDLPQIVSITENLNRLGEYLSQIVTFSQNLSEGNINVPTPMRGNILSGYLKELQANLRHLTWQVRQVEKGDYLQRVDFWGDFSAAFNNMTQQLDQREKMLHQQVQELTRTREMLSRSYNMLTTILESMNDIVLVVSSGRILYANSVASTTFRLNENHTFPEGVKTSPLLQRIINIESDGDHADSIEWLDELSERWYLIKLFSIDWAEVPDALLAVVSDYTAVKSTQHQLEIQANVDTLTGIPNRRAGLGALDAALNKSKTPFVLCNIDLDNLKAVNDTYGHEEGDVYICLIASTISSCIRDGDLLWRMGGDEFYLLLPAIDLKVARSIINRIKRRLATTIHERGITYHADFSIGMVEVDPALTVSPGEVMAQADRKMYQQKRRKALRRNQLISQDRTDG